MMLLSTTIKQDFWKLLLSTASEEEAQSPTGHKILWKLSHLSPSSGKVQMHFQYLTGIHPETSTYGLRDSVKDLAHFLLLQKHTVCLILLFKSCFKYFKWWSSHHIPRDIIRLINLNVRKFFRDIPPKLPFEFTPSLPLLCQVILCFMATHF